jgi:predicted nucleic acid-binding protein
LISALAYEGIESQLLNLLLEKKILIVVSDYILEETRRSLSKKLKEKKKERAIELFNSITSFSK